MKTLARKIYMFNNYLRLAEIKAVLEGRGFSPPLRSAQFFGKLI